MSELGQNFIFDKQLCRKLLSRLPSMEEKRICEIGPGPGIFTSVIKELKPKELLLFEKDERLKPMLQDYNVIWGDFLKVEKPQSDLSTWIVGNLPFNVSTLILMQCLKDMHYGTGLNPDGVLFMFQKEVALRICAPINDRDRGRLAFMSQIYSDVEYIKTVDKSVFTPMPKVDGAMVLFKKKTRNANIPDFVGMDLFMRNLGKQPRKTLKIEPFANHRLHQLKTSDVVELFHSRQ